MTTDAQRPTARVRDAFRGARVLVTGASGFLGTAMLAKLLGDLPEVDTVLVLVRSRPGTPAADRVRRRILGSNAFDGLRTTDDWPRLEEKVRPVDGDLRADGLGLSPEDRAALADVDIVIHAAASVSFDAPVDDAFETNLAGPLRLLDALDAAGARPRRIVHVSTAYVAGAVKGHVAEAPWTDTPGRPRLDWRAELDVARRTRSDVESHSRAPEQAGRFEKEARRIIGPAGAPSVAARAEQLRRDWVSERLIDMGRGRARSLGWPDSYTFTKALAETALLERSREDDLPFTIVRPSIIESALRDPYPGWIRGFRMTDPIIIAYGRGSLPEFPGIPDAVVDVTPVDFVVNACLVAAAADPIEGVVHVSTGNRNPLLYRDLVGWTHDYFHEHPYIDEEGQPILPALWKFPGRRVVERRLRGALQLLEWSSRLLEHLPQRRFGDLTERVDGQLSDLRQAEKYLELYGGYAEVETVFDDERARTLVEALEPAEWERFRFDPHDIDWRAYLQDIHLPEITRRRGTVRRRPRPAPASEVRPGGSEVLAVFDLEGTVLGTNVVDTYLWIRLAASPRREWAQRIAALAREVPGLLATERRDRGEFLRRFYRRYTGAPVDEVHALAADAFNALVLPRSFPSALRRVREHRAAGHRVVFLTGALDFTIAPLAPLADVVASARMRVADGRYTGELVEVPHAGDARATYLRRLATELGADLRTSYAYADSLSDLPMLESVGHPVAVNPDGRLGRIARDRRWPVEQWTTEGGAPRFPLPTRTSRSHADGLGRGA